jgi:hypothetical protein
VLSVAIRLAILAGAAAFGLGGLELGFAVVSLTALFAAALIAIEYRQPRLACPPRRWTFRGASPSFSSRLSVPQFTLSGGTRMSFDDLPNSDSSMPNWVQRRFRDSLGSN